MKKIHMANREKEGGEMVNVLKKKNTHNTTRMKSLVAIAVPETAISLQWAFTAVFLHSLL